MIIGIDLDEVLASHLAAVIDYHNATHGTALTREQFHSPRFWEVWGGTREEAIRKVDAFYQTPYFKESLPMPGAQEAIRALAEQHTLHVITARPETIADDTQAWIDRHFPGLFSGIHFANHYSISGVERTKLSLCDALHVELLVDDSPDFALECVSPQRPVLLLDHPWNRAAPLPPGIHRCQSWAEVVVKIDKIQSPFGTP